MNDTNREVAEWALFLGGELVLEGSDRRIHDVSELPRRRFQDSHPRSDRHAGGAAGSRSSLRARCASRAIPRGTAPGTETPTAAKITARICIFSLPSKRLQKLTFSYHFLDRTRFHDPGLETIQSLPDLRELSIRQTGIKGRSLAPFKSMVALDVSITPFDDAGMDNLAGMANLRRIWAGDTLVTDAGVAALSGLQNLEDIDLHGTAITDGGLRNYRS